MRAKVAAPLGDDPGAASTSAGYAAASVATDRAALDFESIPVKSRDRLVAEGITSLADWSRLPRRRRHSIFGVTTEHVRLLDALAKVRA